MSDALSRLKSALASRYTIERELGRGGMAVYVACQVVLALLALTAAGVSVACDGSSPGGPASLAIRFSTIQARNYNTCGVDVDGLGYCWGRNEQGQLGNGDVADTAHAIPVRVAGDVGCVLGCVCYGIIRHECRDSTAPTPLIPRKAGKMSFFL